jgi:hypothetical protein
MAYQLHRLYGLYVNPESFCMIVMVIDGNHGYNYL